MKRNSAARSSVSPRIASVFLEEICLTPKAAANFEQEMFEFHDDVHFSTNLLNELQLKGEEICYRPRAPTPTSSPQTFELRESPVGSLKEDFHIESDVLGVERGSPGQRSQDSGFSDSKLSPPQSPNTPEKCKGSEFCSCLDISLSLSAAKHLTPSRGRSEELRYTPKPIQVFTPSRLSGEVKLTRNFHERLRNPSPEVKEQSEGSEDEWQSVPHVTRVVISPERGEFQIINSMQDASVEADIQPPNTKRNSGTQTDVIQYAVDSDAIVEGIFQEKKIDSVNYNDPVEKRNEKTLFIERSSPLSQTPEFPAISRIRSKESFLQRISPSIKKVSEHLFRSLKDRVHKSPRFEEGLVVTSLITPDLAPYFETIRCVTPENNSGASSPILSNYRSGPRSSTPRKKPPCLRKKSFERSLGKFSDKKQRVRWSDMPDLTPNRIRSIPDIPQRTSSEVDTYCTCTSHLNRSRSLEALLGNETVYLGVSNLATKGTVNLKDSGEMMDMVGNGIQEEQTTMDSLEDMSVNKDCLRKNEEVARSLAEKLMEAKIRDREPSQYRMDPLSHWLGDLTLCVDQECMVALQSKDIPLPQVGTLRSSNRKSRPVDYLFL